MTQDAYSKMIHKTGSGKNESQRAIGCDYIHKMAKGPRLFVCCTVSVRRELRNQSIAAHNRNLPWSTKAFVCTFLKIKHHYVVNSGTFADEFRDMHPREWTKQSLITFEEATEAYMVEVIAESHC